VTPAAPTALPGTLTDEEEARAAELEAEIVAQERQAETAQKTARVRSKEAASAAVVARTSSLTISASEEYAYVARDVKRIALVGGSLIALLFILWVLAHVTGFGPF
jgi:outer membrane PBP1 activator LpoA protein